MEKNRRIKRGKGTGSYEASREKNGDHAKASRIAKSRRHNRQRGKEKKVPRTKGRDSFRAHVPFSLLGLTAAKLE